MTSRRTAAASNGRVARDQLVGQLHRHLRGGDFAGVEAAGDEDDDLAFLGQLFGLTGGQGPGIFQLFGDGPVFVETGHVFLGRDDGHDHRPFQGRRPDGLDAGSSGFPRPAS